MASHQQPHAIRGQSPGPGVPSLGGWLLVMLSLLSFPLRLQAQDTGAVAGTVISSWDASPLAGVVVSVRGTTLAAQTDANGRYEIRGVAPGDQVLRLSKSGFATAVVTDVRVLPGQTTTLNGNLRPEFYEMEEYEVTAEEFTDQTTQILFERQQSAQMVDGIGADQISRLGAGDAAEALGKVAGASIADGKFAVIRGLADRYTFTTLNGTELPSADPDRKAAQLDLLPSQVIGRMDVSKTFSPDMAGGFAGGAIDIVTKSYPDDFLFGLSLGTSYNTQASLNERFLASDRGGRDWLAMDDGKRELPAVAASTPPLGTGAPLPNQEAIRSSFRSRQLSPVEDKSPLNSSLAATIGDRFQWDWLKLGYLASLNYKNDYKFYDDGFVRKYDGPRTLVADKTDMRGISEYTWAASAALTLGLGDHHEIKFNYLFVQSAEDEARRLRGIEPDITYPGDSYFDQSVLHWTERNLTYYQVAGGHEFPELKDVKLNWASAFSTATQMEPDYRFFQFVATTNSDPPEYLPQASSVPTFPTRYWRDLDENNMNLRGDLTVPLPSYNSRDNTFKTGMALSDSERDYFQRGFSMRSFGDNLFYQTGDPQDYLDPANGNSIRYYNFPVNITYHGAQTIKAAYAMADWAALDWLRLVGGARWEGTELSLSGFNQSLNRPLDAGSIERDDLLPSASATLYLRENLQLRAAWSETVVRPAYREFAPVAIFDISNGRQILGNPNLTFSESANYDLRLEWFPRPGEIVSLSGFTKKVDSPIELGAENQNGDVVRYLNYDQAEVQGVEAELRLRLDRLTDALDEFTLGFNAAYITSEVPLTAEQIRIRRLYGGTDTDRPLYDQPEFVLNADLTWDHKATGTTLTLSGGVVGRRLVLVGLGKPDEYEEPAPQLDVFLTQKLGKHWKMKLSAKNLLDPAYEVTQDWPGGETVVLKSHTKGITFGLSVGCEF